MHQVIYNFLARRIDG
jgi:hypothetical protein